jgi:hypothetical protein
MALSCAAAEKLLDAAAMLFRKSSIVVTSLSYVAKFSSASSTDDSVCVRYSAALMPGWCLSAAASALRTSSTFILVRARTVAVAGMALLPKLVSPTTCPGPLHTTTGHKGGNWLLTVVLICRSRAEGCQLGNLLLNQQAGNQRQAVRHCACSCPYEPLQLIVCSALTVEQAPT